MDPDVSRWVVEFLLRSTIPDSLIAKTLTVLPLSGADPRLKKTLLLRTLQSMLSSASITETALEILELVEEIDRNDAVSVPDSMRKAYRAVAVECTVKYLAASPDDAAGEYFSAVKRIWRGRVGEMERRRSELFSGEMVQWRDDIEAALWDPRVSERMASLNSRNDAFNEVRLYLKEVWGTMGPSFLDSVAAMSKTKKKKNKEKGFRNLGEDQVQAVVAEGCTQGVCGNAEPVRERGERGDFVGGGSDNDNDNHKHNDNDNDNDDDDDGGGGGGGACCMEGVDLNGGNGGKEQLEERVELVGGDNDVDVHDDDDGPCCMEGVDLNVRYKGKEQLEERGEDSVNGNQESALGEKGLEERGEDSVNRNDESAKGEKVSPLASQKGYLQLQRKLPAFLRRHRGVKISGAAELDPEKSWSKYKYDPVPSPEVKKARECLKSSSLELRALVKDPLPDALDISEAVRSKLASKDTNHEPPIENQSGDVGVPNSNACRSIVLYQPKDANIGNKSSVHHSKVQVQRPCLMERKSTAHTYEWDDSIDNKPQGVLPRRKKRKWTSLEEETLRTGVKMFGEGNWATIRSFYSNIFENRSGVDLKDKWRNMIR